MPGDRPRGVKPGAPPVVPPAAPAAAGPAAETPIGGAAGQRSLLRSLMSDSALYGVGAIASRFVEFLLIPLYTRMFTPAEYGLLDLLLTTSAVLFVVSELQIVSGVARGYYEAEQKGRLPQLIGTALALYFVNALAWAALGAGAFALAGADLGAGVGWGLVVPVLAVLLPRQVFGLLQLVLRFERRPREFVALSLADVVTSGALSLLLIVGLDLGIAGALWGLAASKALWSLVALARRRRLGWGVVGAAARAVLGYGVPLVPAVLAKWGQNYANRYLLLAQLSLFDVGLFGLAVRLAAVVAIADTAFRQAWDPMAAKMFGEEGREPVFARTLHLYLAAAFCVCTVLAAFGRDIVALVSGREYAGAGTLVGFLAFGLLWNGAANLLASGNAWARRTYWNALGFGAGVAVNLGLLAWAAPRWGLLAAGATYLAGALVAAALVTATAQRHHPIPYRLGWIAAAAAASVAVSLAAYRLNAPGGGWTAGGRLAAQSGLTLAVVAPVALVLLRRGGGLRGLLPRAG